MGGRAGVEAGVVGGEALSRPIQPQPERIHRATHDVGSLGVGQLLP
jgi:hypothetical protein